MPRFMLDTDTCSSIMKRSHPLGLKRLQIFSVDDVYMSVVTKAELLYGVESRHAGRTTLRLWQHFFRTSRRWISTRVPRSTTRRSGRT